MKGENILVLHNNAWTFLYLQTSPLFLSPSTPSHSQMASICHRCLWTMVLRRAPMPSAKLTHVPRVSPKTGLPGLARTRHAPLASWHIATPLMSLPEPPHCRHASTGRITARPKQTCVRLNLPLPCAYLGTQRDSPGATPDPPPAIAPTSSSRAPLSACTLPKPSHQNLPHSPLML